MKIDKTKIEYAEIISFIPYSEWLKNKTKQPKEVKNQFYNLVLEGPSDVIKEFVEEYYETEMGEFLEFREIVLDPRLDFQINDVPCVEYWRDEDDPDSAVINPIVNELVYSIF